MTENEISRMSLIEKKLEEIADVILLKKNVTNSIFSSFEKLDRIKEILGNYDMELSFIACIMVQKYLEKEFGEENINVTEKSQGAKGLDVDMIIKGKRIIAEIKTTKPCNGNNFGGNQSENIKKDIRKLETEKADYKYFFVTNKQTELIIKEKYLKSNSDIKIINLL